MNDDEIRKSFVVFREQCIWLQCCYNMYHDLYESDEETSKILGTSASIFFKDLNYILIEYILLQVCKITDPSEMNGYENLTVENLNRSLGKLGLMSDEITRFTNGLLRYRALVKDARNKLISHADKEAMLSEMPIGAHASKEVGAFFENLYGYTDAVGNAVGEGPLDYRTCAGRGDTLDLIKALKRRP